MRIMVRVDAKGALRTMENLKRNIPRGTDRGMRKLAEKAVKNLKDSAISAGLKPFRHNLFNFRVQKTKYGYGVYGSRHSKYIDSMKPHWVSVIRHPMLQSWRQIRWSGNPKAANSKRSMFVVGHPFIGIAVVKTEREALRTIGNEVRSAVASSKA